MKYMLDTNICIFAMKKSAAVISRIISCKAEELCISSITYSELTCGVEKSSFKEKNRLALAVFLSAITIVDYDSHAAEEYGVIRAELESSGQPIGPMDMLIASHCKSLGLTLVTNNTREFDRIKGLELEDWS